MSENTAERPGWLSEELYPFADHYVEIDGARVHYVDEGTGRPLLLLHGNPTWSFLYRDIVTGLRGRFRCIAPDYPGFGLSTAPPGYGYTPAEHAKIIEGLLLHLDLTEVTVMVQDWGGPIGFAVATRHPDRFAAFVIGNTWAWPKLDLPTRLFAHIVGGPIGGYLIRQHNSFVERFIPSGVKRKQLSAAVMAAYRGPFPTPQSRRPMHVFPREILASKQFFTDIAAALPGLADRPALIVWADRDVAFRDAERRRWEATFHDHRTVILNGAGHYLQEDAAEDVVAAILEWQNTSGARDATGAEDDRPSTEHPS